MRQLYAYDANDANESTRRLHWAKRHIFATEFARIRIGTRGVYDNILKYSRTHDATYT